jgi:predicted aldo/keto reductase-like oxidoreductase
MTVEEKKINRRNFLKTAGSMGAASMVALSSGLTGKSIAEEVPQEKSKMNFKVPTRIFGKTQAPVSILSLGGIDFTSNEIILKIALRRGINYWDTAHAYANGNSEIGIGQYFARYPEDRKKVFLCTKSSGKADPDDMTKCLDLSLERMKTDYIDLYFMWHPSKPDLLTPEVKAWAEQRKREGKIKFFGFSTHNNMATMMMHASKLGWIDGIMATYNYHVMLIDDIKAAVEACYNAGIGLTAMKTQGAPFKFFNTNRELAVTEKFLAKGYTLHQAKLKTIWANEMIASCCSKMKNLTMLNANALAAIDKQKLSANDMNTLEWYAKNTCSSYCAGCSAICESAMGPESRIPDVLRYMMYYNSYDETEEARRLFAGLPGKERRSIPLRDYTVAESICPNRIEIGKMMREASRVLS